MKEEALKRIFEFLEEKEKHKAPFIWKLENDIPLTKEDLNVKCDLNFRNAKITSLPKGLKVGGYLDLSYSKIISLPEGLEVGDDLYLHYSKTKSLPQGLKVGGDLDLRYSKIIISLPEGLKVGGDLFIIYSPLKKYTDDQLREMIKPGFIKGTIYR